MIIDKGIVAGDRDVVGRKSDIALQLDTLQVPEFAGARTVTTRYQRRTQLQYLALSTAGLFIFYFAEAPHLRVAGLACLFPGAGFLAVGGILGSLGLLLSLAFLPLTLFAWFGAGGFAFVIGNWVVPALVSVAITGKSVWTPSAPIAVTLVAALIAYALVKAKSRNKVALSLRSSRNSMLEQADYDWQDRIKPHAATADKRQLSHTECVLLQNFVELAFQKYGDWENFNVIDQFQTSALRYQLYDIQYSLALVQKYYMPSFQGYMKTAQEEVIEKSTSKDVMGYWKWESLWGKFTLDWDPVVRDNIMVTGYLLLCLSLYEKLNGDRRYLPDNALVFRVTDTKTYRHGTRSIFNALMNNWNNCSYCLFPCEPNWIYSGCNLIGMKGALAYESVNKTKAVNDLLHSRWHRAFEEEFMNPDGSIVALRSAITGFPILGLAGVIGDVGGALTCAPIMPKLARRLWHISRATNVRKDAQDKFVLENLVGADNMDVGNYTAGSGFAYAMYSACAGEFGEDDLKKDLLNKLDTEIHPIEVANPTTGSMRCKGMSVLASGFSFRARLLQRGDWANLINCDIDERVITGPKLADVKFPEILVAMCHLDAAGTGMNFVLYAKQTGLTSIVLMDLKKGKKYVLTAAKSDGKVEDVVYDVCGGAEGQVEVEVAIETGRANSFSLVLDA